MTRPPYTSPLAPHAWATRMTDTSATGPENDTWWVRHAHPLKTAFRILLGVAWLTDGILKFTSGFANDFLSAVQTSQANAPSWLSGW